MHCNSRLPFMPSLAPRNTLPSMRSPIPVLPVIALWVQVADSAYDAKLCNNGSYDTPGTGLTYVPNAWNADSKGFSCVAIRDSPPAFDVTWKWSSDPGSVHSYPHVKFSDPALPVPLSNISALTLSAQWAMGPGSTSRSVPGIDSPGLAKLDASANAAFDIFADRNPGKSQQETEAETEIMVWLGRVGYAQPLGYEGTESYRAKLAVGHVDFALYLGTNQRGTSVFTWAAQSNETSFSADISPLLQYLWRNGLVSAGSNMGLIGFGTEGYHADGNVTFSATRYDANVLIGPAPTLNMAPIPTLESTPSAVPSPSAGRLYRPWLSGMSISGIVGLMVVFL
ncbi:concanavalin A-like lectin/glucanase domain-containing protein [Chaetomium fimeti]|uniref:Concanavalin A-like lectin/glucanase domain-containing protein n=1 Tax=Chaetomium fimeti TaxID=1854472 RepID=A0AAE0HF40_9PEZI|nr:concanavalin A-like lectin/glucanase domain-containing protein [Chaetomium fimeti]